VDARRWLLLLGLLLAVAAVARDRAAIDAGERAELRDHLERTIASSSSFEDRFAAEVWLLDMSTRMAKFIEDPEERLAILQAVHREARAADLKPDLVLGLIEIESRFDRFAVSRAGAQGLMQVMPFWRDELGRPDDNLTDIDTNLRYGCHILQFYLEKERGHLYKALARYNGSVGQTWYPELVMNAWQSRWLAGDL
jgi:soluble lytic murein transglycosylase-like protein